MGESKKKSDRPFRLQKLSAIATSIPLINIVIDIWTIADATAVTMIILMTVISQHFGTNRLGHYCLNGL